MKPQFHLFLFLFCFPLFSLKAQDILPVQKNQVYMEVVGNNFPGLPFSLNYSRKIIREKMSFDVFGGIGFVHVRSERFYAQGVPYVSLNLGTMIRAKYKRNGVWGSFSGSIAKGFWDIQTATGNYPFSTAPMPIYTSHKYNFCFTGAAVCQFQWKEEKGFCRIELGLKATSGCFSKKYRDVSANNLVYPVMGVCIGGGFGTRSNTGGNEHEHGHGFVGVGVSAISLRLSDSYSSLTEEYLYKDYYLTYKLNYTYLSKGRILAFTSSLSYLPIDYTLYQGRDGRYPEPIYETYVWLGSKSTVKSKNLDISALLMVSSRMKYVNVFFAVGPAMESQLHSTSESVTYNRWQHYDSTTHYYHVDSLTTTPVQRASRGFALRTVVPEVQTGFSVRITSNIFCSVALRARFTNYFELESPLVFAGDFNLYYKIPSRTKSATPSP